MTGTSRIGILLLLLLAGWVVFYYLVFSPIAHEDAGPESGVNILESDTVGSNPDEKPPTIENQPRSQPSPRQPEQVPNDSGHGASPDNGNAGNREGETKPADPIIPPPPPTTPYTVRRGETMETIAANWFGVKSKWVLIAHENPLVDPLKLKAGQNLRLPAKDAKIEGIPLDELRRLTRSTKYVVADGDSLWKIAAKIYGNGALNPLIADANRDVLGRGNDLQIGMELVIPPYQKPAE